MALLTIPDQGTEIRDWDEIAAYLRGRGIRFERWTSSAPLAEDATPDDVLHAYGADVDRLKREQGYQACDVISVLPTTANLDQVRQKFLTEHTHSEDEVRYFVEGSGLFWFHQEDAPVFRVTCEKGDLIAVPANTKHWFDFGPIAYVKCIRLFTDPAGWVANYTGSGIDASYNPAYGEPAGAAAGA
ncbi:MAG: 1,2-dihydroxy-3-keto-5-methylthiopentene dioxygenase [Chloroflexota bacterium]|jgi:1,2-dihydroxy-3-keto-5-methylthiopentene dioxygenase|nr:1,2-dihydroxy-3-keto-5-methylthiopentene dioxygenase [Chloroflexota bacterium]